MHIDKMSLLLLICRQQLERSESLRVAGQRALAELKAEFEALTGELVAEGQLSGGDAAAAVAHAASVAADQQQRGPSGELGQRAGRVPFRWIIRLACRRERLKCAQLPIRCHFVNLCRLASSRRHGSGNAEQSRGHSADGAARAVSHVHVQQRYHHIETCLDASAAALEAIRVTQTC